MSTKPEYTEARDRPESAGLLADNRAAMDRMEQGIELIVAVMVGGLLAAFLLPIAIDEVFNTSTANWSGPFTTLWDNIPIFIVLTVFLMFIAWSVCVFR